MILRVLWSASIQLRTDRPRVRGRLTCQLAIEPRDYIVAFVWSRGFQQWINHKDVQELPQKWSDPEEEISDVRFAHSSCLLPMWDSHFGAIFRICGRSAGRNGCFPARGRHWGAVGKARHRQLAAELAACSFQYIFGIAAEYRARYSGDSTGWRWKRDKQENLILR